MKRLQGWMAGCLTGSLLALAPSVAMAGPKPECSGGLCGTPHQSGGGGCGCGGGSILINNTDLGDTYQYADDYDNDGFEDDFDNCPFAANADQADTDGDTFGDVCDNCAAASNPEQTNADGDAQGDVCDSDSDNDGIANGEDDCALFPNPGQVNGDDDADHDGQGNLCDNDDDNDGVLDPADNCPLVANPEQNNADAQNPACNKDQDLDGILDNYDNCPAVSSLDVADHDADGQGDACDLDLDNDGISNLVDNCKLDKNPTQVDGDRDGQGDACDSKFCFRVDSAAPDKCLDPESRFFARPGPDAEIKTGDSMRLRLFANRPNAAMRYTWAMEQAADGARNWAIKNPRGSVTHSSPWEYHYQEDRIATFTANEPGTYVVRLETELAFDDDKFPGERADVQKFTIKVTGDTLILPANPFTAGGCSSTGGSTSWIVGLGMLALMFRRRRG